MTNTLTSIRTGIKDALESAGVKAVDSIPERVIPPVCIVTAASPFITTPQGANPFGYPYTVNMHVLVFAGKGTNKTTLENLDLIVIDVVNALDDDWDITEVTAPMALTLNGNQLTGVVVTLETNTKLEKEVI